MPIEGLVITRKDKRGSRMENFSYIYRESMENNTDFSLGIYLDVKINNLRKVKPEANLCKSIHLFIVVASVTVVSDIW